MAHVSRTIKLVFMPE